MTCRINVVTTRDGTDARYLISANANVDEDVKAILRRGGCVA